MRGKNMPVFNEGDIVRKVNKGKTYEVFAILATPDDRVKLSEENEPFYSYQSKSTSIIWITSKSDMEDGSFEKVR